MSRNLNEQLAVQPRPDFLDYEILSFTAHGEPLKVRIARPDPEALAVEMQALPGERPEEPATDPAADLNEISAEERGDELSRRLVARFASVQLPEGEWVSPAFSFTDPPDPNLLDGREIELHELRLLALGVMSMGCYAKRADLGGSARATFLGERGGRASGDGAGLLRPPVRDDASGSAA